MISNSIVRDGNNMITELSYKVSVDSAVANLLSPGIHTGSVRADAYIDNFPRPLLQGVLNVSVDIIDNVILSLSKSSYNFYIHLEIPRRHRSRLPFLQKARGALYQTRDGFFFKLKRCRRSNYKY